MRRLTLLAAPLGLLLAMPAAAQHWNDTGPGKDLMTSTGVDFDAFRQRLPAAQPSFSAAAPATGLGQQQARGPIPILDWVPPPPVPVTPTTTRRRSSSTAYAAPRRTSRRAVEPVSSMDPQPLTPSVQPVSAGSEVERSLAERERELDRLRRILEEDRLRYQQRQQPQLR